MMQVEPTIIINRLLILKGNKYAYDELFHNGVNIIRSYGNSAGKTTIMDAIFFILGGDVEEWSDEALACDYVVAEISFRGNVLTFKREIGSARFPPIYIYEGSFVEAATDSLKWLMFSHKRSGDRESFSQAIFRLLGYPENKLSSYANITMHEILRLVYSDQLTAVNKIFKHQNFDSDEMRQTVGEFLLGVDDLDLHGLRLKLRDEEKELATLNGRIKATQDVFLSAGLSPDGSTIIRQIEKVSHDYDVLRDHIKNLESSELRPKTVGESENAKRTRIELTKIKNELKNYRDSQEELAYEIKDSTEFISSLKDRKNSLNESEVTRESMGELRFDFCPACLMRIDTSNASKTPVCHLCKKEKTDGEETTGFLRMQFELNYQITESEQLLDVRKAEFAKIYSVISEAEGILATLQDRYNSFLVSADPISAELKDSLRNAGQYGKILENLREKQKLVEIIETMSLEKASLMKSIAVLYSQIENKEVHRKSRWSSLKKRISDITIDLLRKDVPSEETFASATEFDFDFTKNKMLVDGRSKFSASSVCYLKTAFLFALFMVSLEDEKVLFPRFSLLDNIEDKGSTPARVQNMHNLIITNLLNVKKSHQIIFTTSLLADDLNESEFCVGPQYNFHLKTLNLHN